MDTENKEKLTISIDGNVLEKAKEVSKEKGIPLSRAIENFLVFFSSPWMYCFSCGERFNVNRGELCSKCGWIKCPDCKVCRCALDDKTASSLFYMRRAFEDLLGGRIK